MRSFDLYYRPNSEVASEEEVEIDEGEAEIGFYEGGGIELEDILREQVLLALPMQRVCSDALQGNLPGLRQVTGTRPPAIARSKKPTIAGERSAIWNLSDSEDWNPRERKRCVEVEICRIPNADIPSSGPPPGGPTIP